MHKYILYGAVLALCVVFGYMYVSLMCEAQDLREDIHILQKEVAHKESIHIVEEALWWSDSTNTVILAYLHGNDGIALDALALQGERLEKIRKHHAQ